MSLFDEEEDERPRRRRRNDDDRDDREEDDRPARSRRNRDEDDDRPARRRRDDDEDDAPVRRQNKKKSSLGLILGILAAVFLLCGGAAAGGIYFVYTAAGDTREKSVSSNNMKQVTLAIHNYHDVNGVMPANSYSATGQPLLSWRVHILPYVEQDNLYRQFNLNEPWDGPQNKRLLSMMPVTYATPAERSAKRWGTTTFYRGFSSPGTLFEKNNRGIQNPQFPRGYTMTDVTDGLSNTIIVVEAGDAVEWTKPDDLDISPGKPMPRLGGVRPQSDVILAGMADGSVRSVRRTTPENMWRFAATRNGGEVSILD